MEPPKMIISHVDFIYVNERKQRQITFHGFDGTIKSIFVMVTASSSVPVDLGQRGTVHDSPVGNF